MKTWQACVFAIAATVVAIAISSHAQEKDPSYPQTRSWVIEDGSSIGIKVTDTAGVCLYTTYVVFVTVIGDRRMGTVIATTAVPKTQLPKGAGCQ